jgi:predicted permease
MGLSNASSLGIRHRLRNTALLPIRNPIIIASALGALVSATHFHVPKDVSSALSLLGGAAVPIALVTLGMSLHAGTTAEREEKAEKAERVIKEGKKARIAETAISVLLKTALHPVLAYLLARYALGLPAHDVLAVTLCAALPTAQNAFIYASEYDLDTAFARNAVIFSTVVSMAGLWTVAALLR